MIGISPFPAAVSGACQTPAFVVFRSILPRFVSKIGFDLAFPDTLSLGRLPVSVSQACEGHPGRHVEHEESILLCRMAGLAT